MPSAPKQPSSPSPPQLFLHKPSRAQLKKARAKAGSTPPQAPPPGPSRSAPSMDSSSSSSSSSAATPELNPKRPFLRRIFPLLLVVNFAVGAYVLLRTTNNESAEKEEEVPAQKEDSSAPVEHSRPEAFQSLPIQPAEAPKKVLPPIPDDQQRELFKWVLAEKRKVKPADPSEKKKLDEEKALLKQYIRTKSIPSL